MGFSKVAFFLIVAVLSFYLLLLGGCATPTGSIVKKSAYELKEMEACSNAAAIAFREGRYQDAEKALLELSRENTVSRPLYLAELGSVYIAQGRELEARKTLMQAQAQIELLFDTKSEKEAASLFGGELKKVYKGDPYERSSLYALLALLFLDEGDVDNALACCKSGLLHDADSAGEIHSSDYAMLHLLASLCYKLRGNDEDAKRMRDTAFKIRVNQPQSPPKAREALMGDYNVLLVFWVGFGPSFLAKGEYGENRIIMPGSSTSDTFAVVYENTYLDAYRGIGDVSFQATTRGGRLMDNVLKQKASLKHGTKGAGNVLLGAGAATAAVNPYVGLGIMAAGLLAHGVSYAMNPEADIRHWKNLPDEFILIPITLPPGKNKLRVLAFKRSEFIAARSFTVEIDPEIPLNTCQIVLNDIGSNLFANRQGKLLDSPLVFAPLILKAGNSAVFTQTQVEQAADELYKLYEVKNGVWPKEVLYYLEQPGQHPYPATERFNAWKSTYINFCKAMLKNKKDKEK